MPDSKDVAFGIGNLEEVLRKGKTEEEIVEKPIEKSVEKPKQTENMEAESEENATTENEVEKEVEVEKEEEEKEEEEAEKEASTSEKDKKSNKDSKNKRDTNAELRVQAVVREKNRLKEQLRAQELFNKQQQQAIRQEVLIDPEAPSPYDFAKYPQGENDIDYKVDVKLFLRDRQEKQKNFQKTVQEIINKYPDTKELLDMDAERVASGIMTANPTTIKLMMESDVSGELLYYLLANSDEAIEIAKMDPVKTAKHIGKLEARIENMSEGTSKDKKENISSKKPLPPPLKSVKTSTSTSTVNVKNFGFSEY